MEEIILSCWIVDDEPLALSLLESYVNKTPFLKLTGKYSNALSAVEDMVKKRVDLIFLDIQMPGVNGMEFARMVDEHTRIIFTTAFPQYALEGYRVDAMDYLLKPFSFTDFFNASRKALTWFEMSQAMREVEEGGGKGTAKTDGNSSVGIFVKADYKLIHILYEDILYIEGLKDYVKIFTEQGAKPILSLISLKSLEEELPADRFVRVHRSFIVNKSKISTVERNRITIGKKHISIGDTYRKQFIDSINPF